MLVMIEPKVFFELQRAGLLNENTVVFNLNSNSNVFQPIYLMPPREMLMSSHEFDQQYVSLILTNDVYFMEFMKLVNLLKDGKDVFIMTYNEETTFNPISETLFKFIQQRYGYDYQEVHSIYDYNPYDNSGFSTPGIIQFDSDFNRYEELTIRANPYYYINEPVIE